MSAARWTASVLLALAPLGAMQWLPPPEQTSPVHLEVEVTRLPPSDTGADSRGAPSQQSTAKLAEPSPATQAGPAAAESNPIRAALTKQPAPQKSVAQAQSQPLEPLPLEPLPQATGDAVPESPAQSSVVQALPQAMPQALPQSAEQRPLAIPAGRGEPTPQAVPPVLTDERSQPITVLPPGGAPVNRSAAGSPPSPHDPGAAPSEAVAALTGTTAPGPVTIPGREVGIPTQPRPGPNDTPIVVPSSLDEGFRLLSPGTAAYPSLARRMRISGEARIELEIGTDGQVQRIKILSESGDWGFGAAAKEAYRKAAFTPPTADGRPVRVLWRKTLRFLP